MRSNTAKDILNETSEETKKQVLQHSEQILREYEEYIELPHVEIKENKILIYNFQRKGNSCPAVIMGKAEASLYYIELYKFLTDEFDTKVQ